LLVLVAAFAGLIGLVYYFFEYAPVRAFERLQQEIMTELPLGTDRAAVEQWFKQRRLSFSDLMDHGRAVGLYASIPQRSFWGPASIEIEMYFDGRGRLEKRIVDRELVSF
jgi:hypothetical protein